MRRTVRLTTLTLMLCLSTSLAMASGTPAGTLIDSQALVSYTQAGTAMTTASNTLSLPVNEVLDFTVAWQDATDLPVYAGDPDVALTFRLQNTGNGHETFHLTVISALSGDDFDPLVPAIYFDTNADGVFDPTRDDRYTEGINDPELAADQPLTVFLVSTVPTDLVTGDRGYLKLAVGSEEGYGVPGTVVHGQGDGNTDAIIGAAGGFAEVSGQLVLTTVQVNLSKAAEVINGLGQTMVDGTVDSTSVITYSIAVSVTGNGTAREVIITDSFPAGTKYRPGSLLLNNTPLTDAADGDVGLVQGTTAEQFTGGVVIALGDMTANTPKQQISFQVTLE